MDILWNYWQQACKSYESPSGTLESSFEEIQKCYSEKHRHYHNVDHLKAMLGHYETYQNKLKIPEHVLFAIFYHDIIYHPQQRDNEQASSVVASRRLNEIGLGKEEIQAVCEMILGSQHHLMLIGLSPDCGYFFDFDLAVLGSDWDAYQAYSEAIRKEYQIYPDEMYYPARKIVLEKILGRKQIYQTDPFVEAFELQARHNLKQEIDALE